MPDNSPTLKPAPVPTPPAPAKPDALRVPHALVNGATVRDRIHDVLGRFGSLLQVEHPVLRNQQTFYFVSTDESQLLQGRFDGPMSGQSRYRWETQADGVEYGYLVEGA